MSTIAVMYIFPRENSASGKPIVRLYTQINIKAGKKDTNPAYLARDSVTAKDIMEADQRVSLFVQSTLCSKLIIINWCRSWRRSNSSLKMLNGGLRIRLDRGLYPVIRYRIESSLLVVRLYLWLSRLGYKVDMTTKTRCLPYPFPEGWPGNEHCPHGRP